MTVVGLAIETALALTLATGWLAKLTLPSRQTVRVRNAFLLRRGHPDDFTWTPFTVPPDFRVERKRAPAEIEQAVRDAGLQDVGDDWERARALATLLVRHWKHDGAIRADLLGTYQGIVGGAGYCSDFVRVYMAAAASAGLFCRQWAFSFDGFGGHGHTFVEVYDRKRSKWNFLDVHNNVYAVSAGTEEPTDAMTLRESLLGGSTAIEFRRAGPGRLGFEHFDKLLDYYRRGGSQWYLWWGNDVITRNDEGLSGALLKVSGRLAHRFSSALGLPPIVVVVTADNEPQIARMESLKRKVTGAIVLVAVLGGLLGVQLWLGGSP